MHAGVTGYRTAVCGAPCCVACWAVSLCGTASQTWHAWLFAFLRSVTLRCACRCTSAAGVGANYTFTVAVDGGASSASADALSYAPPVINSLSGPGASGASTTGGAVIFLNGSNFGPVDATTVVRAWSSPSVNDSLVFPGVDCVVVEAHIAIR
jgi:hypothetical protein